MQRYNLLEFTGGWVVGDFIPSILRTKDAEVAIKRYKAHDSESDHTHKIADEITIVVDGIVRMNGIILTQNSIVHIKAGESADFQALTNATTCVIKLPSVIGDKYPVL